MLHLGNQILERRIRHIANEQIPVAVLDGQEVFIWLRGFRCHGHIFVVLGTTSRDSRFQVPGRGFVVSGATLRGFGYQMPEIHKGGAEG